jgi:hypothetical protein
VTIAVKRIDTRPTVTDVLTPNPIDDEPLITIDELLDSGPTSEE